MIPSKNAKAFSPGSGGWAVENAWLVGYYCNNVICFAKSALIKKVIFEANLVCMTLVSTYSNHDSNREQILIANDENV